MPGRAGRELVALDEHHVVPAFCGQVIEDARTNGAATDDYDAGMIYHDAPSLPPAPRQLMRSRRRQYAVMTSSTGRRKPKA